MTRNLAHRLSASIYEILDSNDFKIDAPADTTTKCTEWMPCTYIGNHWSCSKKSNDRDVVPSCQIPWAIFQQICVKWNHTGLPEGVQNQQRDQRMRMIHILMMNIIHITILMVTNFLYVLAFSPVYPVYQMCRYIHLYNPINPSIFAGSYCRAYYFDMVFHSTEYTQMHWLELPSAFKLWFDILTCLTKYFYSSAHICGIISLSPHTMIAELKTFH